MEPPKRRIGGGGRPDYHRRMQGAAQKNLRLYDWFSALSVTPIMLPVIVLFWRAQGLDLFDIFLLQAIFATAVVALEIPTGLVADRWGKRRSLILGTAVNLAGMLTYAGARGFATLLTAELLLALGMTLISGAGAALLYDSLAVLNRTDEAQARLGHAAALQMVSFALANIAGGLIGAHSLRATVVLSGLGPCLGLVLALRLREVGHASATTAGPSYAQLIRESGTFIRRHRLVRWQIVFLAMMTGSGTWLLWLYQPYMEWCGWPVAAFGVAFAAFNIFAASISKAASRIDKRCGRFGTIGLLMVLQTLPLLVMAAIRHPLGWLAIFGHQAARGLVHPVLSERILRYTYADKRATVLSIGSAAGRLFFAATAPWVGFTSRSYSLPTTLTVQAVALVAMLGGMAIAYKRLPAKYFAVKAEVVARRQGADCSQ